MSKVAHIQRPLIGPWLDWNQLPDSVREQALDVLTVLLSRNRRRFPDQRTDEP